VKKTKVVVVGGGFAGLAATMKLAKDERVEVTLVDKNNYHTFQPLLYQVATTGLEPGEVCPTLRAIFREKDNVNVLMGEMEGLEAENSSVVVDGEKLEYDYLMLAIGGRTTYFGNESWRAAVPGLKGLQDALEIRTRFLNALEQAETETDEKRKRELLTVAIVGGGPTGVELAGALAELKNHVLQEQYSGFCLEDIRIVLIEALPRLLPPMPEGLGNYTKETLEEMGVEVILEEPVSELEERRLVTEEREIRAETIVWAAGIEGRPLVQKFCQYTTKKGTVEVLSDLRMPPHPNVFCAGDMVHLKDEDGDPLPGLAPVAQQQGSCVADNILALIEGENTKSFHYFDKGSMAVIGRSRAVANVFSKISLKGPLAWLAWLFVHLLSLLGFRNRAVVLVRWFWSYMGWRHSARVLNPAYLPE